MIFLPNLTAFSLKSYTSLYLAILLFAVQLKHRYIVNEPTALIPLDVFFDKNINLKAHFMMYDYSKYAFFKDYQRCSGPSVHFNVKKYFSCFWDRLAQEDIMILCGHPR
jgi:hypothetical protein